MKKTKKTKNKNKRNKICCKIIGIILSFFLVMLTFFTIKGFGELIATQNSVALWTFYGLVTIIIVWQIGSFFEVSFNLIFDIKGMDE